jgi:hypothetical protein
MVFFPTDVKNTGHGNLLKNMVLWTLKEELPVLVEGLGLIDTHLYRQGNRLVLHLVNLTNENTWKQSLDELIPFGPLQVKLRLPAGITGSHPRLLVSGQPAQADTSNLPILLHK